MLAFVLSVVLICPSVTYAESNDASKYNAVAEEITGNMTTNSTMPFTGPLKGATKSGKTKKFESHTVLRTLTAAIAFVAKVSGVPATAVDGAELAAQLLIHSSKNQYYTRTKYESPTKEMYYYKYDYYTSSSYSKRIGSSYSYVYSIMY